VSDSFGGGGNLGSAEGRITIDANQAMASLARVQGGLSGLDNAGRQAFRGYTAAGMAVGAVGAGLSVGLGAAINMAANFEQQMSAVAAVSGATVQEMEQLEGLALQIGKDSAYSATEAAFALEELVKAGISVENVMLGAADGAVALAAAGGVDIASAASVMSAALNQFQLSGDQAVHVADLLAASSSTSAAGVLDLGEALKYVGTQANLLNIPIEETITAISILADQGIKGSMAGTSLNQALLSVTAPTQRAATKMAELGISVTDLNGNFKDLPSLIKDVYNATKDLGDVAKADALDTIFGVRGGRAINALLVTQTEEARKAGKTWEEYYDGVNQAGAAAEQAAKRLDNLKGAMEFLRGSIETLVIVAITPLLGIMKEAVMLLSGFIDILSLIPGPILATVVALTALAAAVTLGVAGFILMQPHLVNLRIGFAIARQAVLRFAAANMLLIGTLGLLAGALAIGFLAYQTNFGGFGDFVDEKVNFITRRFGYFKDQFTETFDSLQKYQKSNGTLNNFFKALGPAIRDGLGIQGKAGDRLVKTFNAIGRVAGRMTRGVGLITNAFGDLSRIVEKDGIRAGIDRLFGDKGQQMLRGFGLTLGSIPRVFGGVLNAIETGIGPLDGMLSNAGRGFEHIGRSIEALFAGDFDLAGERFQLALQRFLTVGEQAIDVTIDIGKWILGKVPPLWEFIKQRVYELFGGESGRGDIIAGFAGSGSSESSGRNIPIDEVGIQIGRWAISALQTIGAAIHKFVFGEEETVSSGGVIIGSTGGGGALAELEKVGLRVVSWAITSLQTIEEAIKSFLFGDSTAVSSGGVVVEAPHPTARSLTWRTSASPSSTGLSRPSRPSRTPSRISCSVTPWRSRLAASSSAAPAPAGRWPTSRTWASRSSPGW
jgi:TP901 family phage tail tape measure protein